MQISVNKKYFCVNIILKDGDVTLNIREREKWKETTQKILCTNYLETNN